MPTDAELAGLLMAVGFVLMGLVALPIVKWFLIGARLLGGELRSCFLSTEKSSSIPRCLSMSKKANNPETVSSMRYNRVPTFPKIAKGCCDLVASGCPPTLIV